MIVKMPDGKQRSNANRRFSRTEIGCERLASMVEATGAEWALEHNEMADRARLLEGSFVLRDLGCQLNIHATEVTDLGDIKSEMVLQPSFTVSLLLEGKIDATLDGQALRFAADREARGKLWSHSQPVRLKRNGHAGERVRKVNITLPAPEFHALSHSVQRGLLKDRNDQAFLNEELVISDWTPSKNSVRCAEEILANGDELSIIGRLSSSMLALQIVHDALTQLVSNLAPETESPDISIRDVDRARAAGNYIAENIDQDLQLPDIAKATGMSVSTLQRVFRNCHGVTVMQFMRATRLEIARQSLSSEGISVTEAAHVAGYSNTSSFSTAFLREFGYPPSSCLDSAQQRGSISSN